MDLLRGPRGWLAAGLLAMMFVSAGCGNATATSVSGDTGAGSVPGSLELLEVRTELKAVNPLERLEQVDDSADQVEVMTITWTPIEEVDGYVLRLDGQAFWLANDETEIQFERDEFHPPGGELTVEAVRLPPASPDGLYDEAAMTVLVGPTEPVELPEYLIEPHPRRDWDGASRNAEQAGLDVVP
jgi:hypothetical protein